MIAIVHRKGQIYDDPKTEKMGCNLSNVEFCDRIIFNCYLKKYINETYSI
jgi:hypothetical protein